MLLKQRNFITFRAISCTVLNIQAFMFNVMIKEHNFIVFMKIC
jgi:hypothetical protein